MQEGEVSHILSTIADEAKLADYEKGDEFNNSIVVANVATGIFLPVSGLGEWKHRFEPLSSLSTN